MPYLQEKSSPLVGAGGTTTAVPADAPASAASAARTPLAAEPPAARAAVDTRKFRLGIGMGFSFEPELDSALEKKAALLGGSFSRASLDIHRRPSADILPSQDAT
jgi:hypothetical protein